MVVYAHAFCVHAEHLEAQIGTRVYALYGLTDEDIKIVES